MWAPRSHYENFPVASWLLPPGMRPHVAAVYAFARAADDFADEGDRSPEERYALLDGWQRRLHHAAGASRTRERPVEPGEPDDTIELFIALGATIRDRALPVPLFEDLLSAFRQDVGTHRYASWDALLDYCRRSANPVGRLVLRIAGYDDPELDGWSDAICTGLQLVNFWQDLQIDFDRGRIYAPLDVLSAFGAAEEDLASGMTDSWRRVLGDLAGRTRGLFVQGRPLCSALQGRLRYEIRATWLGGIRILDRLEANRFDVFARRPVVGIADVPWLVTRMALWSDRARPGQPV